MRNARPFHAALAALCTLTVALPLLSLFDSPTWLRTACLFIGVVGVTGVLARMLSRRSWVVVGIQGVALLVTLSARFALDQSFFGMPTSASIRTAAQLLSDALSVVQNYAVPAPTTPGIVFAIALIIGLAALVVDYLAVTRRAPAAAGIPLLAAFLASATNSGDGLAVHYFVLPAVAWLALVGEDALANLRRWGSTARSDRGSMDPSIGFAARGRVMGALALTAAVFLPGVLPMAPPTFLADGLGRADNSRGAGGAVELNSTADLTRSLQERSTQPVMTYRTTARSPEPLRVDVLDRYSEGVWSAGQESQIDTGGELPQVISPAPSVRSRMDVGENRVRSPQLALPPQPVSLSIPAADWRLTPNGVLRTTQQVPKFTVESVTIAPPASLFASVEDSPDPSALSLDAEADVIANATDAIVPRGAAPLDTAQRIQRYLRGSQFTYSLDLAGPTTDSSGRSVQYGPLQHFLVTKRGYCVQFASAMIMMSRSRGIPARMAVGYLPGTLKDQSWSVTAADAHAWPELWFKDLGWVRFEPTPSGRTGVAPSYTLPQDTVAPSASASSAPTASASPTASSRPETDQGASSVSTSTETAAPVQWLSDHWVALALLIALVLAVSAVPFAAWHARRSARRTARTDAERTEAQWLSLLAQLQDVGISTSTGATPRQAAREIGHTAYLDESGVHAMTRVVATLERARYAPPGSPVGDASTEVDLIKRRAYAARQRRDRLAAYLWPSEGRHWWSTKARAARERPIRALARWRR